MPNPNPDTSGLRPPWTSETAPRQPGRKNFGLSLVEWCNEMANWSKQQVEKVRDDETETIVRRRAAERVLDEKDVWNVVEHTHHRPLNKNENTNHDAQPTTEAEREAARDSALARIRSRISRPA